MTVTSREALIWADFGFGANEAFPAVAGRASFGGLRMADFGGSKSGPARSIWEGRMVCHLRAMIKIPPHRIDPDISQATILIMFVH